MGDEHVARLLERVGESTTEIGTQCAVHAHLAHYAAAFHARMQTVWEEESRALVSTLGSHISSLREHGSQHPNPVTTKRIASAVPILEHQLETLLSDLSQTYTLPLSSSTLGPAPCYLSSLPPEIIHFILFAYDTSASDVLSLALTSHHFYATIFGPMGGENAYDVAQFRAKSGIGMCARQDWPRAASIALSRGYGDPFDVVLGDGGAVEYPIRWAARSGYEEIVAAMMERPDVDPSVGCNGALLGATENGHVGVVRLLVRDPRVDPTDRNLMFSVDSAFDMAVEMGSGEMVGLFLAHPSVDPAEGGNQPLRYAAYLGHDEVVRVLISDPRVDPAVSNSVVLREAAREGHEGVVRVLLEDGRVDVEAGGKEAIRLADQNGHPNVVALLSNV